MAKSGLIYSVTDVYTYESVTKNIIPNARNKRGSQHVNHDTGSKFPTIRQQKTAKNAVPGGRRKQAEGIVIRLLLDRKMITPKD